MSDSRAPGQLKLRSLTFGERQSLTATRLLQGSVMGLSRAIPDSNDRTSQPLQALSTLALMERRGSITARQRRAGEEFHRCFRLAHLDRLKASDLTRPLGGIAAVTIEGHERAHKRIIAALRALGGERALTASCAWHVLGEEWSLRNWAIKATRGNIHQASGVLLAILALLENDFGA